jgi:hypothetical protein
MKTKTLLIVAFIFAISIPIACVEPINLKISTNVSILSIDGTIDDSDREQYISIKKSLPSSGNVTYAPEKLAKVSIKENGNKVYDCVEKAPGLYYLPIGFKTIVGNTYVLNITLSDGKTYKSEEEKMRSTPEISLLSVKFEPEGITRGNTKLPAHAIYLDSKDSPETGDYYLWSWKLFEKQNYCKTCEGSYYVTYPAPQGKCIETAALREAETIYDYACDGNCWDIFKSQDINIMSDVYSNGNEIKNRLIGKIPYFQTNGFLIEVTQQNVSPSAFRYLKILASQSQTNGTLADAPPAALIGNITNINDKYESVGGYFRVGNAKTKRLWVNRTDAIGLTPLGFYGGRLVNPEPAGDDPNRPPRANCVKSETRTPVMPEGWRF